MNHKISRGMGSLEIAICSTSPSWNKTESELTFFARKGHLLTIVCGSSAVYFRPIPPAQCNHSHFQDSWDCRTILFFISKGMRKALLLTIFDLQIHVSFAINYRTLLTILVIIQLTSPFVPNQSLSSQIHRAIHYP